jgi:hypothetical protein
MDVYLVPVARDRHELYCEVPDEPEEGHDGQGEGAEPPGFLARIRARFRAVLAEAERERRQARAAEPHDDGWINRVKRRAMRWIAESIAEQRLLWHLRRQTDACLFYPDDLEETRATADMRSQLTKDFERHRLWLVFHTVAFILSGLLALVPGPNVIAYYFAFRLVGHFFSMRGAKQGLSYVTWTTEKSAPLAELRRAIGLEPEVRERRVHDVALRLRLEHLATFFERTAVPS